MISAVAIRTAGESGVANEMARRLADPALRRQIAELERQLAEVRQENEWLKWQLDRKRKAMLEASEERLMEYKGSLARKINRRNRVQRFINLFVEKDPVEEGNER